MTLTKPIRNLIIAALMLAILCAFSFFMPGRPHYGHGSITLTRADGTAYTYKVEVARSEDEQEYGLMYVRSMADDNGMIFTYDHPHEVAFWMKNTYIPLDMIFVSKEGRIGTIVTNARPFDMMPIPSQIPVSAVIELNAGQVRQKGFTAGDKVDFTADPP